MMLIHLQSYLRLLGKLTSFWILVIQSLLAMLLIAAVISFVPVFIQHLLDEAFVQKDPALVQTTLLTIIALIVVRTTIGFCVLLSISKVGEKLATDLYQDFFDKLLSLPVSAYAQLAKDHQIEKQISAIRHITQSTIRLIATAVQDCLIVIGLMICLWHLHRELLLLMLFITPFIVLVVSIVREYFDTPDQKIASKTKNLIDQLSQSIANYRVIKVDGGQVCESKRLGKICQPISQAETQQALAKAAVISIGQIVIALILCALGYMTALQLMYGTLGLTAACAALATILLLLLPLSRLINLPRQLAHDHKVLETVFSFADQKSEQHTGSIHIPHADGKLVFEQVRLVRYAALSAGPNPLNLTVDPGDVVIFKGYDTVKKNAIIDLLLRMKSPAHGRIFLDDQPMDEIKLDDLYANITLLPTVPILLDEKIAENIAYGVKRCTHEAEITAAARDSHAMTFIRKLPGGLQTRIDTEGVEISRQQLQLLAIARAYVKNAPILIVEEMPTTQDSDAQILLSALQQLMQNRTTLIFCQQIPHLHKIDQVIE